MQREKIIGVLALCLALAACQGAHGDDKGDGLVVVQVGDDKVTLADVKVQQPGATAQTADPAGIARIVDRKLLAQAAEKAKVGGSAADKAEAARATEVLKANAMVKQIAADVPAASAQKIDEFIAAHPEAFADRRYLVIDQIELKRTGKEKSLSGGPAVRSIDDVQARLQAAGIGYHRSVQVVDTAAAAPDMVGRLLSLPAGAVFELGNGDVITEGQLIQNRSAPFGGPLAREYAASVLKTQMIDAAVAAKLAQLRRAAGGKIKYSGGFAPPT